MFEPKTPWERRAALNENLLQELIPFLRTAINPKYNPQLNHLLTIFQQNQQALKDNHAFEVLGLDQQPVENMASKPYILAQLQANMGRTYFQTGNATAQQIVIAADHDGAIGTATFGQKWKEWTGSLAKIDDVASPTLEANFYSDNTFLRDLDVPVLLLPIADEYLVVVHLNGYLSLQTLNLTHMPEGYTWEPGNRMWRTEFFSYRGNISKAQFSIAFGKALAKHGQTSIYVRDVTDEQFADIVAGLEGIIIVERAAPLPMAEGVATSGFLQVDEEAAPANDEVEVTTDAAPATGRGQSTVFVPMDEAGYVEEETPKA